jgi:hypothetical protein
MVIDVLTKTAINVAMNLEIWPNAHVMLGLQGIIPGGSL